MKIVYLAILLIVDLFVSLPITFATDLLLCVNTKDGTSRVVSAGPCRSNEVLVALPEVDRVTGG
jgi:hypothetical protein